MIDLGATNSFKNPNASRIFRKANNIELDCFDQGMQVDSLNFLEKGDNFHVPVELTFKEEINQLTFIRDNLHLNAAEIKDINQFNNEKITNSSNNNFQKDENSGTPVIQNPEALEGDDITNTNNNNFKQNEFSNINNENEEKDGTLVDGISFDNTGKRFATSTAFGEISSFNKTNKFEISKLSKLNLDEAWDRSALDDMEEIIEK